MNGCLRQKCAGGAVPLTALALPALLAAVALALLFARLFALRYQLWQTADQAALAATRMVSEESLWQGKPRLDAAAARAAALAVLRDNGLALGETGVTVTIEVMEGRVIRARKAAPEVRVRLCQAVQVPLLGLAGREAVTPTVCAEARAAVLRPKRLLAAE